MEKFDARSFQPRFIVAVFLAEVDHGADAMNLGEMRRAIDRETAADGKLIRQPMEIEIPRVLIVGRGHEASLFFIFVLSIFFFIFELLLFCGDYCCFDCLYREQQSFKTVPRSVMSHSKAEPTRA